MVSAFVDIWSLNNNNYGIFPTLSKNGVVTRSRATGANDSGIWVETSDNIQVTHSLMEDNVNGLEISNSDDVYAAYNEMRNNTVGVAVFVLQDALFCHPARRQPLHPQAQLDSRQQPAPIRPPVAFSPPPRRDGHSRHGYG